MFWYMIIVVGAAWLALLRWQWRKLRSTAKQFPCDIPAWPVIGHSYNFIGTDEDRMTTFKKFGREAIKHDDGMAAVWLADKLYIVLADPEAAETILKNCLEKDQQTMGILRLVIGDGLIFAPVNIWRPRRKIAAPTFSLKNLNSFVEVFARQSAVMVEQLQPVADGRDFSIWKYLTTYTFDSVCETMLGIQLNAQKENHPFIDAADALFKEFGKRILQPWLHYEFVYRLLPRAKRFEANKLFLFNFIDKIVHEKQQELAQREAGDVAYDTIPGAKKSIMRSFLELLIESSGGSQGYDKVELREEALVMLIAGTDTSAVGSSYAALMLSRYPEEQAKVYEEIQGVFGDSDRPIEAEDLPKLKYLEVFLKETLRMYPPVPITSRAVHSDFVLPSGKSLVAGTRIILNIWAMHRNQHYWGEDVEQFRPERFLQPLRHPAQFMPFSYGMRNCLGYQYAMMSMKSVVASLMRRYRVLPPAGMSREEQREELRVNFDIMMKHADDYVLRLEPRL